MKAKRRLRVGAMAAADVLTLACCCLFALSLAPPSGAGIAEGFWSVAPVLAVLYIGVFWRLGLYGQLWRYAGAAEYLTGYFAAAAASALAVPVSRLFFRAYRVPAVCCLLLVLLVPFFTLLTRGACRFFGRRAPARREKKKRRLLVVGAGMAASTLIGELQKNPYSEFLTVGAVDDDPFKQGRRILGVPILGPTRDIPRLCRELSVDDVIVAVPSATDFERGKILDACHQTRRHVLTLPNLYEMMTGTGDMVRELRAVPMEELLGRRPVNLGGVGRGLAVGGKRVLVTGAGGSIGSELCRQIAAGGPRRLVMLDICENGAYELERELSARYPGLSVAVAIASVRDEERLVQVMKREKPDFVFHAAAHKHVPLMEEHPCEAVKNNVFGTLSAAKAAIGAGVGRFVLISTDKAVNPTSVMGATKRLCEMILCTLQSEGGTEFVAVRFGNVLGSSGSVIPLFKRQIADGGPVTVTHPEITRYFMTIPEAVSLVLQAASMARGGEIFILDMGRPVKIRELAENLIRLSGYTPGREIQIVYTGLRPGEKLYEELCGAGEERTQTEDERIFAAKPMRREVHESGLCELRRLAYENDAPGVIKEIKRLVPEYRGESPEKDKI